MATAHCPLCGLRYLHRSELDQHVRDEHAPAPPAELRDRIPVPHRPTAEELERPIDRVLRRRR